MKTTIFIRVWSREVPWLEFCLKSIRKFATNFEDVVLAAESAEAVLFKGLAQEYGATLASYPSAPHRGQREQGYLCAQWASLIADKLCPKTDLILHMDCDCVFTEPVQPEDYLKDGKPVLVIESYDHLTRNEPKGTKWGVASTWRPGVQEFLMMDTRWETMRRMPAIHYVQLYDVVRDYVCSAHGKPINRNDSFREFCLSRRAAWPPGVCDFNILGGFVMGCDGWQENYHIVNLDHDPLPKNKMRQFWSHQPPTSMMPPAFGSIVPVDFFRQLGL